MREPEPAIVMKSAAIAATPEAKPIADSVFSRLRVQPRVREPDGRCVPVGDGGPGEYGVGDGLPGADLFYCETIVNPTTTVPDLTALSALCREAGVVSAVDNTFASPYLCNPVTLGFDVSIHSATKYIGGHA